MISLSAKPTGRKKKTESWSHRQLFSCRLLIKDLGCLVWKMGNNTDGSSSMPMKIYHYLHFQGMKHLSFRKYYMKQNCKSKSSSLKVCHVLRTGSTYSKIINPFPSHWFLQHLSFVCDYLTWPVKIPSNVICHTIQAQNSLSHSAHELKQPN